MHSYANFNDHSQTLRTKRVAVESTFQVKPGQALSNQVVGSHILIWCIW